MPSTATKLAQAKRTKQFENLLKKGLKLVSTPRQIANGSLAFTGSIKTGSRKTIRPSYVVTANGAVLSNEFVARRVKSYSEGLAAVAELLDKRLSA